MNSLAILASLALAPQTSTVLVVDAQGGPGVDHTEIFEAAFAAPDGAVLLVKPGTYLGFDVPGKSLSIVADNGGPVQVPRVGSVGTGPEQVLVDGLEIAVVGTGADGVETIGPQQIWLEDLTISGSTSILLNHGILLGDGATAQIVGVDVPQIVAPTWSEDLGFLALRATNSEKVAVWDSALESQHGGYGSFLAHPGAALSTEESFASGSTFRGGSGSSAIFDPSVVSGGGCLSPGEPGSAIETSGVTTLVDSVLVPGQPGISVDGICPGGTTAAPAIDGSAATLATLGARTFDVTGVVRPGDAAQMTFGGAPGELAVIGVSTSAGYSFEPALSGVLALGGAPTLVTVGTLDGAGSLTVPFTASLPPGTAQLLFAQSLFVGSSDGAVLGTPRTTLLLGAGF